MLNPGKVIRCALKKKSGTVQEIGLSVDKETLLQLTIERNMSELTIC
jgi:hypothetical protein